jgi:hypothetical protein
MDLQKIAADYGISVDVVRERWLSLRVAIWKSDFKRFAKEAMRIRTKAGDLEPLEFNDAQEILHNAAEEQLRRRALGAPRRPQGTPAGIFHLCCRRGYWRTTLWDRQRVYILSHEMAASNTLFDMTRSCRKNTRSRRKVGTDNAKELEFVKRGSSYQVATAGQKAGGRGGA